MGDNGASYVLCTKWLNAICVCDANKAINFWNCLHNMHQVEGKK